MNEKKSSRQLAIEKASRDFKSVVIYFTVTRPTHCKRYFVDGVFSRAKLMKEIDFLSSWKSQDRTYKRAFAKTYANASKTFNYTFGIPSEVLEKVLGYYRDDNGKKHRVKVDEVLEFIGRDKIKVIENGRKFATDDEGKRKVKFWWTKKYLIASNRSWHKLLSNETFSDIKNFASPRVIDIIFKYSGAFIEEEVEKDDCIENHEEKQEKKQIVFKMAPENIMKAVKRRIIDQTTAKIMMKKFFNGMTIKNQDIDTFFLSWKPEFVEKPSEETTQKFWKYIHDAVFVNLSDGDLLRDALERDGRQYSSGIFN